MFNLFLTSVFIFVCDYYFYQALRTVIHKKHPIFLYYFSIIYWLMSFLCSALFLVDYHYGYTFIPQPYLILSPLKRYFFLFYSWKIILIVLLGLEDVKRIVIWLFYFPIHLKKQTPSSKDAPKMTRSEFLSKTALIAGGIPLSALSIGIIRGASEFQLREVKLHLPNLPKAFHGLRIAQFSDVHAGSFSYKSTVSAGVELLIAQKTDIVFFTGDWVNYAATEIKPYFTIFSKIKATLGVFSVLGNHDYGDYGRWKDGQDYDRNRKQMYDLNREMGYDLLQNIHRILTVDGEKLAIIGVDNWGIRKPHPQIGDIQKASQGTEEIPVKLLLSHDPSHWDAKVRPLCPEIDVMFSGHTHGMQAGIEFGDFQWSLVQYVYPQWAGLYQKGTQQLYVNRGFGVADIFPGRIGMPPEITVFELLSH